MRFWVTIKQGADTIPVVIPRALVLETFSRHSLVADSVDLALEPKEVKMRCFELS
jgi:hypothetical protein